MFFLATVSPIVELVGWLANLDLNPTAHSSGSSSGASKHPAIDELWSSSTAFYKSNAFLSTCFSYLGSDSSPVLV